MKQSFIEASTTGKNLHHAITSLGRATAMTPLKTHFIHGRDKIYIRVPDDIQPEKFVCAAKDRGFEDAKLAVTLTVI